MADFVSDAELSIEPMATHGWDVEYVSWRDATVDWQVFDAVYICTPWDYPEDPEAFLGVLDTIEASRARLVNPLALVRWNLDKTYLRDVEERGGAIVPSRWCKGPRTSDFDAAMQDFDSGRIVVKPVIGANAVDTFVVGQDTSAEQLNEIAAIFDGRRALVQPYIESVESAGEYSLFFFAGKYSHAIRKVPAAGDFRVQEEHGADIQSVSPPAELLAAATGIVALVEPEPVYARADFVEGNDGEYLLMELELIEPSLYLRTSTGAAEQFARAFDNYCRR